MKNIRAKLLTVILLAIPFLLTAMPVFARAGGGSSSGGGSWIVKLLLIPIALVYMAIKRKKIDDKKRQSKEVIELAAAEDPAWNLQKLETHSKNVFLKMQMAWMNRDLGPVKKLISADMYEEYKTQLDVMRLNKEKNILEAIEVDEVSIISSEDYIDKSRDAYVAYIHGKMTDYTINEVTGNTITNKDKKREPFSDTYHFIRSGNDWLLNHINNKVKLKDIDNALNIKE